MHQPAAGGVRPDCRASAAARWRVRARRSAPRRSSSSVDQAGAQAIIHVVVVVGDLVGEIGELGFEAGLLALDEPLAHIAQRAGIGQRAMLQDAFAALEGQVQAGELGVALLEFIHHAQRLQVVLEAAVFAHAFVQRILPGMAERRMAEVVREADGFGQRSR